MTYPDDVQKRGAGYHASWQVLGARPSAALVAPRVVVERALALVAWAGHATGPSDGDAPLPLEWLAEHRVLAGPVLEGTRGCRCVLRVAELTLMVLGVDGAIVKTRPLDHCSPAEVLEWLRTELGALGVTAFPMGEGPGAVPPSAGAAADVLACSDRAALEEIEGWLVNADHMLRAVARTTSESSPVGCPADRLELSTQIRFRTRGGEDSRHVRVGVSLGDAQRSEPCFFVEAAPVSSAPEGWEAVGEGARAVLPAQDIVRQGDPVEQAATVEAFLDRAIPQAHALVQREWRRR
jgi:hypothetical protein